MAASHGKKTRVTFKTVSDASFPPPPLSKKLQSQIVCDFCVDADPSQFQESGCAVCGQLVPLMKLKVLSKFKRLLQILEVSGVTCKERKNTEDPVTELDGPVLDQTCDKICDSCRTSILKGNVPSNALANGLWIGEVPEELSSLRFVERLLIARV